MIKRSNRISLIVITLLLMLLACKKSETTTSVKKEDIVIGTIGVNALEEIRAYQPLIDYLNAKNELNTYNFKAVVFTDLEQMKESLRLGQTHIYIDSPFPVVKILRSTDLEILLNRLKHGVRTYHSVVFVRKDSDIESIEDLPGRVIAFEDRSSTSSYFLPKASLVNEGLLFSPFSGDKVADDRVGYSFSNADANTALWVFNKKVDVGATNNIAYADFPPKYHENFKIIYKTERVPRHLIACRSDLNSSLKATLKQVLLTMHTTEQGRKSLEKFENTRRFEEIEGIDTLVPLIDMYLEKIPERD